MKLKLKAKIKKTFSITILVIFLITNFFSTGINIVYADNSIPINDSKIEENRTEANPEINQGQIEPGVNNESNETAKEPESFPMDQLGAKAQDKMNPDSLSIEETQEGIILKSDLQKLKGTLTKNGMTIESTSENEKGAFSIKSKQLYRNNNQTSNLNNQGEISLDKTNNLAILNKNNLQEQYSTSGDGIKQDFLITNKPEGEGKLILSLDVQGATVKSNDQGIELTLNESQRKLVYNKLKVTDKNNQELTSKFIIQNNNQIQIEVDDTNATYPIKIDPTITDDDWVSMGGGGIFAA